MSSAPAFLRHRILSCLSSFSIHGRAIIYWSESARSAALKQLVTDEIRRIEIPSVKRLNASLHKLRKGRDVFAVSIYFAISLPPDDKFGAFFNGQLENLF